MSDETPMEFLLAEADLVKGGRWRLLDAVPVDSGQIEIIDPVMRSSPGVVFQSGIGDGTYQVWAREVDINLGQFGTDNEPIEDWRIAEVRIHMLVKEDMERWYFEEGVPNG